MKKLQWSVRLLVIVSLWSCGRTVPQPPQGVQCFVNGIDTCAANTPIKLTVNAAQRFQTIHSFGASDSWTTKYIGTWANETKKNQVADYLFSMDTSANGQPLGIGLTLWRFNIGAGSFEQGDNSGIATDWRREECFQNGDGSYNWNKHAGQRWFAKAAKDRGVPFLLGFNICPPVHMTVTGTANSEARSSLNLRNDQYDAFADFLKDVASHFSSIGMPMDFISPFNEPQYNWGTAGGATSQEGTAATNVEIARLVRLLGPKLVDAGLTTRIALGEAGDWNYVSGPKAPSDRSNQLQEFFDPQSTNFLGNVPAMEKLISAHSYFLTCPDNNIISTRRAVFNKRNEVDPSVQLWQTEFGPLGDNCGIAPGYPRNTSIDFGLFLAKILHHDLAIANVTSWQWWLAVNPYNYSDGLVYINDPSGAINENNCRQDGIVLDSKQLWCFGNFSRFVRPGMVRIGASVDGITTPEAAAAGVMVSAYEDADAQQTVIVIVNSGNGEFRYTVDGLRSAASSVAQYTTTSSKSLQKTTSMRDNILIEPKSVTTLVLPYL